MAKKIIKAVLPLLAFGLPQRPGQFVEVEEKQAEEIIESAYGVEATEDEVKKYKSDLAKELKSEQKLPKDVKNAVEVERKAKEAALNELEVVKVDLEETKKLLEASLDENKLITDELNKLKGVEVQEGEEGAGDSEEVENKEELKK